MEGEEEQEESRDARLGCVQDVWEEASRNDPGT